LDDDDEHSISSHLGHVTEATLQQDGSIILTDATSLCETTKASLQPDGSIILTDASSLSHGDGQFNHCTVWLVLKFV